MAKSEFWNNLAKDLRNVTDYQLDKEKWDAMDLMGRGTAVTILGGVGAGAGMLVDSVLESKLGESLPAKVVKTLARGVVAGGLVVGGAGLWYQAEMWRTYGLVKNEERRRDGYLSALSEAVSDEARRKSLREDGRGAYVVAKDLMGAK